MISLVNVTLSYDGIQALNGLNLKVDRGMLLGIMGPGGCGKSSLCRVIAGLSKPSSGVAFVAGCDMMLASASDIQKVQARIGMQFQNDALIEHLSVLANVEYPLRRRAAHEDTEIRPLAMEQIASVGLAGYEYRLPNQLSGGQRRRAALARACVTCPEILICDDPTAGLDPITSRRILEGIAGIRYRLRNTVIVVSSDVQGLMSICDRIALIWDGSVILENTPIALAADRNAKVRRFIDDALIPEVKAQWEPPL